MRRAAISAVKSWSLQFRFLNIETVRSSPLDLIVMDHAPHPRKGPEIPFAKGDIEPLKLKPDGNRRLVIAYLSIGEAERYRYYWKSEWDNAATRPAWLGPENPRWPGDYHVKFSDPEWQSLIFGRPESYLDRIVAAGFDGVFLDRVDAFQDDGIAVPDAEDTMAGFVNRLAAHARRANPQFIIIMQNAEELLRFKSLRQSLDAVAKEDLMFGHDNSTLPNPPDMVRDSVQRLRQARRAGLPVFVLEYVTEPERMAQARRMSEREGFVLHFAERLLGTLSIDDATPAAAPPGVAKTGRE